MSTSWPSGRSGVSPPTPTPRPRRTRGASGDTTSSLSRAGWSLRRGSRYLLPWRTGSTRWPRSATLGQSGRGDRRRPRRLRADPSLPGRQRAHRTAPHEPAAGSARLSPAGHLHPRPQSVSPRPAAGRRRRSRPPRRAHRPGRHRQPVPLRRPRRGRASPVGPDRIAGHQDPERAPCFVPPSSVAVSRHRRVRTASGGAPGPGSTSTSRASTEGVLNTGTSSSSNPHRRRCQCFEDQLEDVSYFSVLQLLETGRHGPSWGSDS